MRLMAKTQANEASATDVLNIDQRISELTQQVRERFQILKQQVVAQQRELEGLSEHHARLTGKPLMDRNGSPAAARPAAKAAAPAKARGKGKRSRKPSPSVEWLQEALANRGMSVRQLQEAAEAASLSGIRIPEILKENKGKFKSEAGERKPGVKGIPAAVWGVK